MSIHFENIYIGQIQTKQKTINPITKIKNHVQKNGYKDFICLPTL